MTARRWLPAAALAVLRHPLLWPTAIGQIFRLAVPGWWRRPPFLPVPDDEYLRFRLETQYGPGHEPTPADVVDYLAWCRAFRSET